MKKNIRVWKQLDIDLVNKHLVIVDEIDATCNNCKKLGLKFALADKRCHHVTQSLSIAVLHQAPIKISNRILQKSRR